MADGGHAVDASAGARPDEGSRSEGLRRLPSIGTAALALAALAGLYARFVGLGSRQLAVDEYYFVTSVGAILETGLPELAGGGYYTRGLIPQYLIALSSLLFGSDGFAWRLPGVLFGLTTVVLTFRYARRTGDATVAATVAGLLLVSSWQVEFDRFIRMYAGFQCFTVLFLLLWDRAFFDGEIRGRYGPHAAAVGAVLSHALGVLLLPLLFVPLLLSGPRQRLGGRMAALRYGIVTTGVVWGAFAFTRFDFRNLGVGPIYPEGWSPTFVPPVHVPPFPFWSFGGAPEASLALLVGVVGLAGLATALARRGVPSLRESDVVAAMLVTAAALHAFAVAVPLAVVLVVRYDVARRHVELRREAIALALAGLAAVGWAAAALTADGWVVERVNPASSLLGGVRRAFFGLPDFYEPLVVPWGRELPSVGVLIAVAVVVRLGVIARLPWERVARDPAVVLTALLALFCLLQSYFQTTRYTYFLYPLALVVVALAARDAVVALAARRSLPPGWSSAAVGAAAAALLFAATADFNPRHLLAVGSDEYAYRLGSARRFQPVWYARYDFRSPARFVTEAARPAEGDLVVVDGEEPVSAYIGVDFAIYFDRELDPRYAEVSRDRGTVELWSGRRLLGTPAELRAYTAGATTVWLVRGAEEPTLFEPQDVWSGRLVESSRAYVGVDGRVEVLRLRLATEGAPVP